MERKDHSSQKQGAYQTRGHQRLQGPDTAAPFARNNLRCFIVELGETDKYKNSLFPRTARDWNNLDESTVFAKLTEEFKDLLLTYDQNQHTRELIST